MAGNSRTGRLEQDYREAGVHQTPGCSGIAWQARRAARPDHPTVIRRSIPHQHEARSCHLPTHSAGHDGNFLPCGGLDTARPHAYPIITPSPHHPPPHRKPPPPPVAPAPPPAGHRPPAPGRNRRANEWRQFTPGRTAPRRGCRPPPRSRPPDAVAVAQGLPEWQGAGDQQKRRHEDRQQQDEPASPAAQW